MDRKFRTPRYEVYVVGGPVVASGLCMSDARKIAKSMTTKVTFVFYRPQNPNHVTRVAQSKVDA